MTKPISENKLLSSGMNLKSLLDQRKKVIGRILKLVPNANGYEEHIRLRLVKEYRSRLSFLDMELRFRLAELEIKKTEIRISVCRLTREKQYLIDKKDEIKLRLSVEEMKSSKLKKIVSENLDQLMLIERAIENNQEKLRLLEKLIDFIHNEMGLLQRHSKRKMESKIGCSHISAKEIRNRHHHDPEQYSAEQGKLDGLRILNYQLGELRRSLDMRLEEISLRFELGEIDESAYKKRFKEIKQRLELLDSDHGEGALIRRPDKNLEESKKRTFRGKKILADALSYNVLDKNIGMYFELDKTADNNIQSIDMPDNGNDKNNDTNENEIPGSEKTGEYVNQGDKNKESSEHDYYHGEGVSLPDMEPLKSDDIFEFDDELNEMSDGTNLLNEKDMDFDTDLTDTIDSNEKYIASSNISQNNKHEKQAEEVSVKTGSIFSKNNSDKEVPIKTLKTLKTLKAEADLLMVSGFDCFGRGKPYYETLVDQIAMSLDSSSMSHMIAVTSSYKGEGVSTVAANLANKYAYYKEEKVLLVDANFFDPSIHSSYGAILEPGLADYLNESAELEKIIHPTEQQNLFILTAGRWISDPATTYQSKRFNSLLDRLSEYFSIIIFDSPAVSTGNSTIRLASKVEGVVLVLESERIRSQVAERTQERLLQANAQILGVVLNKRKFHIPRWIYKTL